MLIETEDAIRSLRSGVCPACGGPKKGRMSLCYRDYKSLPRPLQTALYNDVWSGYAEHLGAALEHLGVTEPVMPKEATDD